MKKISASLFTSVDGVVGEPQTWHFPYYCEELGAAVGEQMGGADSILLFGRVTYDAFAGAWPGREEAGEEDAPMAKAIGDMRKIVVSHSPQTLTWRNSEQLQGDFLEGVKALKNNGEGAIGLTGSVSLIRQLLAAKLLDELHLFVHPVAIRKGLRLFEDDADSHIPLTLLSCTPFKSGTIHLVYGPSDGPALENQDPVAAKIENDYAGSAD